MITVTDAMNTIDLGPYYAILPSVAFNHKYEDYVNHHNAVKVPEGFHYSSDTNTGMGDCRVYAGKNKEICRS